MTVFFTSDLHFGHEFVAVKRGFGGDINLHDLALMDSWRNSVEEDDIVWVLGDLAMGNPGFALSVLSALPGRKRLILGNHDKAHPMHRDAYKWQKEYGRAFEFVAPFARTKVQGQEVLLSHFPYERDRGEARYTQYRLRNEGLPLIHGHTHDSVRLNVKDNEYVEVHVGLDAWGMRLVRDTDVGFLLKTGLSFL